MRRTRRKAAAYLARDALFSLAVDLMPALFAKNWKYIESLRRGQTLGGRRMGIDMALRHIFGFRVRLTALPFL